MLKAALINHCSSLKKYRFLIISNKIFTISIHEYNSKVTSYVSLPFSGTLFSKDEDYTTLYDLPISTRISGI